MNSMIRGGPSFVWTSPVTCDVPCSWAHAIAYHQCLHPTDQRDSGCWSVRNCVPQRYKSCLESRPSCEKANLKQPSTFPSLSSNLSSPMNTSSCTHPGSTVVYTQHGDSSVALVARCVDLYLRRPYRGIDFKLDFTRLKHRIIPPNACTVPRPQRIATGSTMYK
jgi:hypothetical protein